MDAAQRIETFRAFLARRPDDAFARYSLAMALRSADQLDEAVKEFEETARRQPAYIPTYLMLGQVLLALGRANEAARFYEKGIEAAAHAGEEHARSELAAALLALGPQGHPTMTSEAEGLLVDREKEVENVRPALGGLMKGKRALITGVANERSIAWSIAQALHDEGAELVFTYPGETMEKRVRPLAESLGAKAILDCDVSRDEDLERVAAEVGKLWDRVDIVLHAIGFAPRSALDGRFTEVTSREAWRITMDVSAYSLVGLVRAMRPLLKPGASVVTLTYYGAEKVVRNYNVMGVAKAALECSMRYLADDLGRDGIRVNAISAGPIKTLAASAIRGMRSMLSENAERTPLRRNVEQDDCARAALYLCSELARNVTGEVLHVDAGQNILGTVSMGDDK